MLDVMRVASMDSLKVGHLVVQSVWRLVVWKDFLMVALSVVEMVFAMVGLMVAVKGDWMAVWMADLMADLMVAVKVGQ